MDLVSVLSAAGVPRAVLHAAGQAGALGGPEQAGAPEQAGGVAAEVVDEALGRLAGSSLLTFSAGGGTVTAHRLVMRVIRERLARQGRRRAAGPGRVAGAGVAGPPGPPGPCRADPGGARARGCVLG
jgi:hypothetical protein